MTDFLTRFDQQIANPQRKRRTRDQRRITVLYWAIAILMLAIFAGVTGGAL